MANRSADWLAQARRDLEQAQDSLAAGRHEWACFAAHQAAAKAVEHYGALQSQEAIDHARAIVGFVDHQMA
jgi:HEPN domain-containing protein